MRYTGCLCEDYRSFSVRIQCFGSPALYWVKAGHYKRVPPRMILDLFLFFLCVPDVFLNSFFDPELLSDLRFDMIFSFV